MSALVIILTSAMVAPGDGPEKVSVETVERLDLNGKWVGTWQGLGSKGELRLDEGGELRFRFGDNVGFFSFKAEDAGGGKLRIEWDRCTIKSSNFLGIYRHKGSSVIICMRPADEGYPESFKAGLETEWLFILHPVKSCK